MATVKNYRELIAWQRGMDLATEVYESVKSFPKEETYGLSAQLRRSVVSVPSNIAEGQGRKSTSEFRQHLSIAHGSLREAETQILLAARLGYIGKKKEDDILHVASEVGRLINGLDNALWSRR